MADHHTKLVPDHRESNETYFRELKSHLRQLTEEHDFYCSNCEKKPAFTISIRLTSAKVSEIVHQKDCGHFDDKLAALVGLAKVRTAQRFRADD